MTGNFWLDWAILAVSLFNTVLMLWLGLTVLLNAERRTWGTWLTGGSLLTGGLFFISHSAILGLGLDLVSQGLNFWWRAGWVPVVVLPFAWYGVMLWYSGFWDDPQASLHRRQRLWFLLACASLVGLIGLLVFANPLPSLGQLVQLNLSGALSVGGTPLLALAYPLYILLCTGLALDALLHPGPSGRVMGDLARRRARPWLVGVSLVLLAVSLLVAWAMLWITRRVNAGQPGSAGGYAGVIAAVAWFDLSIASLIAAATLLLGQALVAYEVFTGKALPRRGFLRYWRNAVILAAGYGVVIGWSLALHLRPVYSLLLSALLLTVFYALFSWRSYAERERYIRQLRPFVTSQQLYDHLLERSASTPADPPAGGAAPFRALCRDVLGTRLAYLTALGPLAPLAGPPLFYGDISAGARALPLPSLAGITTQAGSAQTMCLPLDPDLYGGALWAVPLWSERGLIGLLLLGEKSDGGLYTQEEIEIARASGERLIDTQASAEMARRLMTLQRQRLAESQVLDRRARRVLHDDVLPRLHAALLSLNGLPAGENGAAEAVSILADVHRQLSDLLREGPVTTAPDVARLGLIHALRRLVADELGHAFDAVTWEIDPEAERKLSVAEESEGRDEQLRSTPAKHPSGAVGRWGSRLPPTSEDIGLPARAISPLASEVLFYAAREAMRNAARHGRRVDAASPLNLRIAILWHDGLQITIEDNGAGLETSTSSNGGSGQGLALHSALLAVVGGTLTVESAPGAYTRVKLKL